MAEQTTRVPIGPLLKNGTPGDTVKVEGWVRTRRDSKDFTFLELNDGSSLANLQIVLETTLAQKDITTGAALECVGKLVESPGGGQRVELKAEEVTLVGLSAADFPLQKKRHGFEYLRTIAHLRVRSNTFGAVARIRSVLTLAVHQFFGERGFLFLPAPIITASDAEGAGEMFRVTTLPPGFDGEMTEDFFGTRAHLSVSGQLQAEVFAQAFHDVYTFGPTFRAENSNTSRHAAEFWMIEPEMAFATLDKNREVAEAFIKFLIETALNTCADDMAFFNQRIAPGLEEKLAHVLKSPFETISYDEAVTLLKDSGEKFEYPVEWGLDLQSEHERYLTEVKIGRPTFVVDYPKKIKAFYMRVNDDDRTVAAMDLLVPGVGEIIGGSQREERGEMLEKRMKEMGISLEEYTWYLDLRKYGSVPHAGFGVGFERLLMYLTGLTNIRDVIPFPRTPGNVSF